ncbi:hypothetical protein [Streptomyces sp. NPDC000878]
MGTIRGTEEAPAAALTAGARAVTFDFVSFSLDSPLPISLLRTAGFTGFTRSVRATHQSYHQGDFGLVALDLSRDQWAGLACLQRTAAEESGGRAPWIIPPGTVVQRRELHDVYGGSRSGIGGSSGSTPNTFLFVGAARTSDMRPAPWWEGDVLVVPGCLQDGDYVSSENQMLIHHLRRGLPLRVFEQQSRLCRYVGEFTVDQEKPVESWILTGDHKPVGRSTNTMWEVQFPLLRLRQLTGSPCFHIAAPPLEDAPRMDLELLWSGTRRVPGSKKAGQEAQERTGIEDGRRSLRRLLSIVQREPETLDALGHINDAQALATLLQHAQRRAGLAAFRKIVENPEALERDLQQALQGQFWIFGGEYAGEAARRRLVPGGEVDIPLIRGDGSVTIVEIKRAMALQGPLVKRYRNGWVPSLAVSLGYGGC